MSTDPVKTDPPLLRDNTVIKTYRTSRFTYPSVRTFFRRHPKAAELPTIPAPLPLLVCIHGLGGSAAQFHPLLTSLVHTSSCLAIDLPGCGRSEFVVTHWDAYTTDALVELLEVIIEEYRQKDAEQGVVLLGHSMGSALCARLASKTSPALKIAQHVVGLVGICPVSGPPPMDKVNIFRWLLCVPGWLFDIWRAWDRRGGEESTSVKRFVGGDADRESKRLQHIFNCQSLTPVWRRMAWGAMPTLVDGVARGGIPGLEVWKGVDVPVFLVAGAADEVTKASEVDRIKEMLISGKDVSEAISDDHDPSGDASAITTSAEPHIPSKIEDINASAFVRKRTAPAASDGETDTSSTSPPTTPARRSEMLPEQPKNPIASVQTRVLPRPANHGLLYMTATARILAALTSDFLSQHVTPRLSLAWQLQYLSKEGKWEVKNLAKWKGVQPISDPIGPKNSPVFVAMKTLREVDEVHSPTEFVKNHSAQVSDVIDISHDQPAYDPRGLEKGGIKYHKFATVSKIPPTDAEVDGFVALVDRIRKERSEDEDGRAIGVHCHYGFNRTGYFIVCYLVERCGYGVDEALDGFARARPNGIRHAHFRDKIHVRYGLEGAGKRSVSV